MNVDAESVGSTGSDVQEGAGFSSGRAGGGGLQWSGFGGMLWILGSALGLAFC